MQVIATKSIHIIIQELMNLLDGNKFSPWENFFVNPLGSDVVSPKKEKEKEKEKNNSEIAI